MSEIRRIVDQLRRSHEGLAWHGPSLHELLGDVTAEEASRRVAGAHSIWELVLHIAAWEQAGRRLAGGEAIEILSGEADWPPPGTDWKEALAILDGAHRELADSIRPLTDDQLKAKVAGKDFSVYFLLHGVVQHNLYHAGQIALLKKQLRYS